MFQSVAHWCIIGHLIHITAISRAAVMNGGGFNNRDLVLTRPEALRTITQSGNSIGHLNSSHYTTHERRSVHSGLHRGQ